MIKVGKYTAAITLVAIGLSLLSDFTFETHYVEKLVRWWPFIIIGLGIEYLIFGMLYRNSSKKLGLALGSVIFAVILSGVVIGFTQASGFSFINFNIGSFTFSEKNSIRYDLPTARSEILSDTESIQFINVNGDVVLRAGDVSQIVVETTLYVPKSLESKGDSIAESSKIDFEFAGKTVKVIANGQTFTHYVMKTKPIMNMVVTVPQDRLLDYKLDMTNGEIDIDSIAAKQFITADTTNGAVKVLNVTANVKLKSTNGSIVVEHIRGSVTADTTNGKIHAVDVDGDVIADSTNGEIRLEQIRGNANAHTTNGSIHTDEVEGYVKSDTTNGSISMERVTGEVEAETTNGGITVRADRLAGNWDLNTTWGDINLYLPENASMEIEGEAGPSAKIRSDFPLSISKGDVSGKVNGGEHRIEIETNKSIGIYYNK